MSPLQQQFLEELAFTTFWLIPLAVSVLLLGIISVIGKNRW